MATDIYATKLKRPERHSPVRLYEVFDAFEKIKAHEGLGLDLSFGCGHCYGVADGMLKRLREDLKHDGS